MEKIIKYLNNPGRFLFAVSTRSCPFISNYMDINWAEYDDEVLTIDTTDSSFVISFIRKCYEQEQGWVVECEDDAEYYFERMED